MDPDLDSLDAPAHTSGLKELAYWSALVIANVACLGLMVLLLFR